MKVHTFPKCCGAGVLIIEHLTGKGKEADLELIKSHVAYAKRNGYRMYDFPQDYGGTTGNPMSSQAVLGGPTDRKDWAPTNSWGMLLAITNPGQREAAERLKDFGFKKLMVTHNPVYYGNKHQIILWGLDMNEYTEEILTTKESKTSTISTKAKE